MMSHSVQESNIENLITRIDNKSSYETTINIDSNTDD